MKKFYLLFLFVVSHLVVFGQGPEAEPNNTFATASPLPYGTPTTAEVGGADVIDYHLMDFFFQSNLYLLIEATNTSTTGSHYLKAEIFNGAGQTGKFYSANIAGNANIAAGETVYDTIYVCGKAIDTFFLSFSSNGTFTYKMEWYSSNVTGADEPNNSFAAAQPFYMNVLKEGGINYE